MERCTNSEMVLISSHPIGKTGFVKSLWRHPLHGFFILFNGRSESLYEKEKWSLSQVMDRYNNI
jgi:hypothetical protein